MAISYEIYETRRRLVSYISYEMTTRVRSSLYLFLIIANLIYLLFNFFSAGVGADCTASGNECDSVENTNCGDNNKCVCVTGFRGSDGDSSCLEGI